jgi:hypothetical protein
LSHTVIRRYYDEIPVPGKPLGRIYHWDSRSLAYPYVPPMTVPVVSVTWPRPGGGILDQGATSSCTGNALTGALECDPDYDTLPPGHPALGEPLALSIYSAAETIDGHGTYPPNDVGSSGTSVCQAATNMGLISGYTHCTTLDLMLQALMNGPVIAGYNWWSSFDTPAADGTITIAPGARVRGGHETLFRGVDAANQMLEADNSWGTGYGVNGSFKVPFAVMTQLFAQGGDCNVLVPLSAPPPVPVPVPVPTPPPAPQTLAGIAVELAAWLKSRNL